MMAPQACLALDGAQVARLLRQAQGLPTRAGCVYERQGDGAPTPRVDVAQFAATEAFVNVTAPAWTWLLAPLTAALARLAWEATVAPYRLVEQPKLIRYDVGGHFGWHVDAPAVPSLAYPGRRVTIAVQCSAPDAYEGGALEIMLEGAPHAASRALGAMTAFPASAQHRVAPVTRGTRHALVCWGY